MQPISSFNSNLGTAIALVGGAGCGKTALAARLFPRTYFNVTDLNFKSAVDYLTKLGQIDNLVGFDTPGIDEQGKLVPMNQQYARMVAQITAAEKDPAVDAIVIDSGTFVEEIHKGKICNASTADAIRLDGFKQWGDLKLLWRSMIMGLRSSGKKVIFTFHEEKEKDASDQIFKYKIAVDGSIAALFPALFSDVWRCEVAETGVGTGVKHVWSVRPLPNQRQEHLKNTYGFTGILTQDEVVQKVRASLK